MERRLHEDWPFLARYRHENQRLMAAKIPIELVMLGDSITEGWVDKQPDFFSQNRVGRGIGGQTTPQMLVRFRQDVIALHPKLVHIMAGTNDIAGNSGKMSLQDSQANIISMAELAKCNGIKLLLASIPPAASLFWNPKPDDLQRIRQFNGWLRDYAAQIGATYVDYWPVLEDGRGGMKPEFTSDGVHPNEQGYAAMRPVAEAAFRAALMP